MSVQSTFWSAFLDGFTMSGLFGKLSIPGVPTLTLEQFVALTDDQPTALTKLADNHKRQAAYATLGLVCGGLSFLACIGAFVYLTVQGHRVKAYVVLGTAVLALIGKNLRLATVVSFP
jgi:hypothetical protein